MKLSRGWKRWHILSHTIKGRLVCLILKGRLLTELSRRWKLEPLCRDASLWCLWWDGPYAAWHALGTVKNINRFGPSHFGIWDEKSKWHSSSCQLIQDIRLLPQSWWRRSYKSPCWSFGLRMSYSIISLIAHKSSVALFSFIRPPGKNPSEFSSLLL